MRFRFTLGALLVVVLSAVAATGIANAAPGNNYTCSGGVWTGDPTTSTFTIIPSGNYSARALKEGIATTEVIGIEQAPEIPD